jgi:hypothetical protein
MGQDDEKLSIFLHDLANGLCAITSSSPPHRSGSPSVGDRGSYLQMLIGHCHFYLRSFLFVIPQHVAMSSSSTKDKCILFRVTSA